MDRDLFDEWERYLPVRAPLPEVVGALGMGIYAESVSGVRRVVDGTLVVLVTSAEGDGVFRVEVLHVVDDREPPEPPAPRGGRFQPPVGVSLRAGDVLVLKPRATLTSTGPVWEADRVQRLERMSVDEVRTAFVTTSLYVYDPPESWELLAYVGEAPVFYGEERRVLSPLYDLVDLPPLPSGPGRAPGPGWLARVEEAVWSGGAVARVLPVRGETLPDGRCRFEAQVLEPTYGPLAPAEVVSFEVDREWCWLDLGRPLDWWTTLVPGADGSWRAPAMWSTEAEHRVWPWGKPWGAEETLLVGDPVVVEAWRSHSFYRAPWLRANGVVLGPAVCTVP